MALVTKNVKLAAQYHVWTQADTFAGDVIGVWESLGNRAAHSVTIKSMGGSTVVRFNVVDQVYKQYGEQHQSWVGLGQSVKSSPLLVGEVKVARDTITIEDGFAQTWNAKEIAIKDIEVVSVAPTLEIIVS